MTLNGAGISQRSCTAAHYDLLMEKIAQRNLVQSPALHLWLMFAAFQRTEKKRNWILCSKLGIRRHAPNTSAHQLMQWASERKKRAGKNGCEIMSANLAFFPGRGKELFSVCLCWRMAYDVIHVRSQILHFLWMGQLTHIPGHFHKTSRARAQPRVDTSFQNKSESVLQ